MGRVFIDPHMFSEEWFKSILPELMKSPKVSYLFSNCEQGMRELGKVRIALQFKASMKKIGRAIEADPSEVERHVILLTKNKSFVDCDHCDDPHIFAAIYIHPSKYVFSKDARLAKCRDKMNKIINKKYCSFIVIASNSVYNRHKSHILG